MQFDDPRKESPLKRSIVVILVSVALSVIIVGSALAVDTASKTPVADTTKALKPQTTCLVTGDPIDTTSHFDFQGQRIYMCCDMCSGKIKADPEKYFQKVVDQGILLENAQKNCPVSGDPIDKTYFTDYKGRRIYFCCKQCITDFGKDPVSYLAKIDQPVDKNAPKPDMKQMKHDGQ